MNWLYAYCLAIDLVKRHWNRQILFVCFRQHPSYEWSKIWLGSSFVGCPTGRRSWSHSLRTLMISRQTMCAFGVLPMVQMACQCRPKFGCHWLPLVPMVCQCLLMATSGSQSCRRQPNYQRTKWCHFQDDNQWKWRADRCRNQNQIQYCYW